MNDFRTFFRKLPTCFARRGLVRIRLCGYAEKKYVGLFMLAQKCKIPRPINIDIWFSELIQKGNVNKTKRVETKTNEKSLNILC